MYKRGVTVSIMVVTILVMVIMASAITVSISSSIKYANLSSWTTEIGYIQDIVNENKDNIQDYTLENIELNVSGLSDEDLDNQFNNETINSSKVALKKLNLNKLGISNTKFGRYETDKDVYAISLVTNKVYYIQGITAGSKTYYTLTESLLNKYDLETAEVDLNSVVFIPSKIEYTNEPITVTVKMPKEYTNVTIASTNGAIAVGTATTEGNMTAYLVNTNNVGANYDITVTYTNKSVESTATYSVTNFDNTKPVIADVVYEQFTSYETANGIQTYLNNITSKDSGSGIKKFKYVVGTISEADAKEYFTSNGIDIINNRMNLQNILTAYTIYAEDKAGNYTVYSIPKGFFPTLVSNEAELTTAIANGAENIKLVADIPCANSLAIQSGKYEIDLNGYTLSCTRYSQSFTFITIGSGANVVIKDSSEAKTGSILAQSLEESYNGNSDDRYNTVYTIDNAGTFTIESGEVKSNLIQHPGEQKKNIHSKCHSKTIKNSGTVNLNGGTITAYISSQGVSAGATRNGEGTAVGIENTGVVNLNSGAISATANAYMEMSGIIFGETRAYAYGVTNSGTVNRADGVTITVSANATKDNAYTAKKDSAEIKQN